MSDDPTDIRVTPPDGVNPYAATDPTPVTVPDHPADVRVAPPAREPVPVGPGPEDVVAAPGDNPADVRVPPASAVGEPTIEPEPGPDEVPPVPEPVPATPVAGTPDPTSQD